MKAKRMVSYLVLSGAVLVGLVSPAEEGGKFSFKDTPGQYLDVMRDGKIAGRYMYAWDNSSKKKMEETLKTYLHVFDVEGNAPITKGPGGEYPHHRGIFIGWTKIFRDGKKYDRWGMSVGQLHQKFIAQEADAEHASFTALIHWPDEAGKPLVTEERTMTFRRAPASAYTLIDFSSKITAANGDLVLDGDSEHAGVHIRPASEVDRTRTVYLLPGENTAAKGERYDIDLPWIAETISLNGKQYSIVEMNHPGNPTGTRASATRDYGRLGFFPKTSLKDKESFTLKYRFWVTEGPMPAVELIQKVCNEFTGRAEPVPKTSVRTGLAKGIKRQASGKL